MEACKLIDLQAKINVGEEKGNTSVLNWLRNAISDLVVM